MLTVKELQKQREAKARVNHETYKMLLRQVQDRLRLRADNRCADLLWQVPPLVPGRPVYKVSHAARYITDKLRRGGFDVAPAAPAPDVHVLYISWAATQPRPRPAPARAPDRARDPPRDPSRAPPGAPPRAPEPALHASMDEATRTMERLKAKLGMGR